MVLVVKNLPANAGDIRDTGETQVWSLGREGPRRRAWQPTSVFLPGEYHGQRSLVGYGPWGGTHIPSLHSSLSPVCISCCSFSALFAPGGPWWKGCFLSKVTLGSDVLILRIGKKDDEGYIKDTVCWKLHKQLCESLFYNKVEKKVCL